VVADFGLARTSLACASPSHVVADPLNGWGTPGYKAPETVTAQPGIGPASDVWALGCALFQMQANLLNTHATGPGGEAWMMLRPEQFGAWVAHKFPLQKVRLTLPAFACTPTAGSQPGLLVSRRAFCAAVLCVPRCTCT
jgi:hypothetical protein